MAKFCNRCGVPIAPAHGPATQTCLAGPNAGGDPSGRTATQINTAGPAPSAVDVDTQVAADGRQREHTVVTLDQSFSTSDPMPGCQQKQDAMGKSTIQHAKEKGQIDPNDEIALVSFNLRAMLQLSLAPIGVNMKPLVQATRAITSQGGADFHAGLKQAEKTFRWNESDVLRKVVFVSDGLSEYPKKMVERLKANGVLLYVIGVGSAKDVDENVLKKMASTLNGELLFERVEDAATLGQTFTEWAVKTQT
jgi:hypothetical protein